MSNNTCPVCNAKTSGKAISEVNFCEEHRRLAITIRDEQSPKNRVTGASFSRLVADRAQNTGWKVGNMDISEMMDQLKPGDKIRICFKKEAANELMYLVSILENGSLKTTRQYDESGIYAVALSGEWEYVERTFVFEIVRWGATEKQWFLDRLQNAIEKMEISE